MRIGLFGGAFDPVHLAHLALAERVRDDAGLDRVWFVPSYKPPHKAARELTRFDTRCDMVGLAITGQPAFAVEAIEKELPPPSFTLHTLRALRAKHPADEFSLILGADSLVDLPNWHEPREVARLADLLVVPRPGVVVPTATELAPHLGDVRLRVIDCPLLQVASRDLRQRVAAGRSVRYLVPRAVEEFIRDRGLYR